MLFTGRITKVTDYGSEFAISYDGHAFSISKNELCGFTPRNGHKVAVDVNDINVVVGVRINGRKFR